MRAVLKWFGIVIASVIGLFIVLAIVATIFAPPRQPSQSPPAASTAAAATTKPPAPSPTPVPEPEPPGFKGFGTNVSPKFGLQPGLASFEMSHDRGRGFEVTLLRAEGDQVEITLYERSPFSLYYEKGPFSVTAVILVEKPQKPQGWRQRGVADPGSYVLNIDADGNWSITLKQTSLDSVADPPPNFQGKGNGYVPSVHAQGGIGHLLIYP